MNIEKYLELQNDSYWHNGDIIRIDINKLYQWNLLKLIEEAFPNPSKIYRNDAAMISPCWWLKGQETRHNTTFCESIIDNLRTHIDDEDYCVGSSDVLLPWYHRHISYLKKKMHTLNMNPCEVYVEVSERLDYNDPPKGLTINEAKKYPRRGNVSLLRFEITNESGQPHIKLFDAFTGDFVSIIKL